MSRGRRGGRGRGRGPGQVDGQAQGQPQGQGQGQGQGQPQGHAHGQGAPGGQQGGGGHGGGPSGTGILEVDDRGRGFLRDPKRHFEAQNGDPLISAETVRRLDLRAGSEVVLEAGKVLTVDGMDPEKAREIRPFKLLTTIDPVERYVLEGPPENDLCCRVMDLVCPLGKGSRALVVAPPRSGKTILLEKIANRIALGYPGSELIVLLVNERPEEATHFRRSVTRGQVFFSTVDEPDQRHVHITEVVGARARRLVELGKDVVLLVDSLTRIGRAFNSMQAGGRTMSGGLDSQAMQRPKAFFGAARKIEGGGSLTIVATALVDTGSRMDEVIFEEFKGTGNLELVLDRDLADRRVFPAIDVQRSGTRREERLVSPEVLGGMHTLRKVLLKMRSSEATPLLLQKLQQIPSNGDFLAKFAMNAD